jgi:hypothetical protein
VILLRLEYHAPTGAPKAGGEHSESGKSSSSGSPRSFLEHGFLTSLIKYDGEQLFAVVRDPQ